MGGTPAGLAAEERVRPRGKAKTVGSSLVLLPTYCERESLPRVIPRLSALPEAPDILVIDDASPDGTGVLADELASCHPRLSVLHRREKEGLGRAYVHGFREALRHGYETIVTMDADLSHAPEDVPRLVAALEEADIAVGSRHVPGGGVGDWPISRQILSSLGSLYARLLLRLPLKDVTSGFRAYRAEALRELDLDRLEARGFIFQVEVLRRILDLPGARAVEVPIIFRERAAGASKLSRRIIAEGIREVVRLSFRRRQVPERRYPPLGGAPVELPRVAVVIPCLPDGKEPAVLAGLSDLSYPREKLEVLVVRGRAPARQRNLAVRETSAEYILFLDDDSRVTPDLLAAYVAAFRRDPTLAAVGGPAVSLSGNRFQEVASLVLSEPWVMGRSAARYRSFGESRFTDERELILCNLCVRRQVFQEVGGFQENLYPNEENEFLERLRLKGWRLLYRPDAIVARPQRETLRAFLSAVHRYGGGRAAQMRLLRSKASCLRVSQAIFSLLLAVAAFSGLATGSLFFTVPLLVYVAYGSILSFRLWLRAGFGRGLAASFLASLVHVVYGTGVVTGLLLTRGRGDAQVSIGRWVPRDPTIREGR